MDNFGYSLHPLLRRHLLLEFNKYENLCLMTSNIDTIDELINIINPNDIYINKLNIQDGKVIFNELLTLKECYKRGDNSEDINHIVGRLVEEGDKRCQPWITML